jgi:hypothetical protein
VEVDRKNTTEVSIRNPRAGASSTVFKSIADIQAGRRSYWSRREPRTIPVE